MSDTFLSIHSILQDSNVNGPGSRLVIWTQGCSKGCPGCFNPETWKFVNSGINPLELSAQVLKLNPDGLTITGGDAFEQVSGLLLFLKGLHSAVI